VIELAQCLNSCPTDEVPSAACICLDLLESLIRASSSTTVIYSMILVALKTLFVECFEFDFRGIIIALDDPSISLPILQALPLFFESRQEDPTTSESCENRAFRFGLVSFACHLTSLLEKENHARIISASCNLDKPRFIYAEPKAHSKGH
jgi:hypothetical protein